MSESTGWICPKCGRVYAPWVKECEVCNPVKVEPLQPWRPIIPWIPYDPYPGTAPVYPWPGYPYGTWASGGGSIQ